MKRALAILWIVVLGAGLSLTGGCAVVESQDVKTSGMWAHFIIEHYPDDSVVAWAVLRVGGQSGTIIDLMGGDYLECNGTRMTEYVEAITNFHWNRAVISPDALGTYEFTLIRPDEEVSTLVTTPALPFIISTDPDVTLTAGTQLEVTWDASDPGYLVNFFLYGTCIQDIWELDVEDNGNYLFQDTIQDFDPQNPDTCTVTLELRRVVEGDVAAEFKSGYTEAKRMDGLTFNYQ
jgi:hypothetical protein